MFSFYFTDGASGRHKLASQHSPINPVHCFSWIWFLAKNFKLPFYLIFRSVHASSQFLLHIFPVISLRQSLVSGIYIAVIILIWVA
jgi:hypothetical protein